MAYIIALALFLGSYFAYRLYRLYNGCCGPAPDTRTVNTTDTESAGACLLKPRNNEVGTVPAASVTIGVAER